MTRWLHLNLDMLRENPNWQPEEPEEEGAVRVSLIPNVIPFLPAVQATLIKKRADTWKFLTGVMAADTEWPRGMEPDMTVAEPPRLAAGHTEFGVCQFQSLSHPNSRMVSTNGQSQRGVLRKLWNIHSSPANVTKLQEHRIGHERYAPSEAKEVCLFPLSVLRIALQI